MRRPDDYDAKKVADLGPSEPSTSLNSLVLAQLKRPPPPPPEPEAPPAPTPAPALPLAAPQGPAPAATGDVEDGEVGGAVPVTRVLKLEHMVRTRFTSGFTQCICPVHDTCQDVAAAQRLCIAQVVLTDLMQAAHLEQHPVLA